MKLESNVCGIERVVRLVLGCVLAGLAFFGFLPGISAIVAYVIAAVALVTGLFKFCPLTTMLGVNTCEENNH